MEAAKLYFPEEVLMRTQATIRQITLEGPISYYTDDAVDPMTVSHKSLSSYHCQGHTQAFIYTVCSALQTELFAPLPTKLH